VRGEPARIIGREGGVDTVLCSGRPVDAGELAQVSLSISGGIAALAVGPAGALRSDRGLPSQRPHPARVPWSRATRRV